MTSHGKIVVHRRTELAFAKPAVASTLSGPIRNGADFGWASSRASVCRDILWETHRARRRPPATHRAATRDNPGSEAIPGRPIADRRCRARRDRSRARLFSDQYNPCSIAKPSVRGPSRLERGHREGREAKRVLRRPRTGRARAPMRRRSRRQQSVHAAVRRTLLSRSLARARKAANPVSAASASNAARSAVLPMPGGPSTITIRPHSRRASVSASPSSRSL